jgi:pyridoxal phosphate phosphatase PHOSPHO2
MTQAASSKKSLVVVWDFDHTMVDDNSDTWVFDVLAPAIKKEVMPKLRTPQACWTDIMDECLSRLPLTVTPQELNAAMQKIPMVPSPPLSTGSPNLQ